MGASSRTSIVGTFAAATATLFVAGAIIAWPSLKACSTDMRGVGTCLRELLQTRDPVPDVDSGSASELEIHAVASPARGSTAVGLSGEHRPDIVDVANLQATTTASLALVPEDAALVATGGSPPVLASGPAQLQMGGRMEVRPATWPDDTVATVALVGPSEELAAAGASSLTAAAPVSRILDRLDQSLGLSATEVEPAPAIPVVIDPLPDEPPPPGSEVPPADVTAELPQSAVVVVQDEPSPVRFDPAFPNVLVLPPPASGENSSIRSLTLN